jgi:hypothetical protein
MVYSRAEHVFILEHHYASKSFATIREAFSNAYPDKGVQYRITQQYTYWVQEFNIAESFVVLCVKGSCEEVSVAYMPLPSRPCVLHILPISSS